jgi:hypothetical protein
MLRMPRFFGRWANSPNVAKDDIADGHFVREDADAIPTKKRPNLDRWFGVNWRAKNSSSLPRG